MPAVNSGLRAIRHFCLENYTLLTTSELSPRVRSQKLLYSSIGCLLPHNNIKRLFSGGIYNIAMKLKNPHLRGLSFLLRLRDFIGHGIELSWILLFVELAEFLHNLTIPDCSSFEVSVLASLIIFDSINPLRNLTIFLVCNNF